MGDTRDLAVVEERSIAEVKSQVGKIQSLMHDLMHEGEHYGASFPGDTKKNLLKPGADKLCFVFRLAPEFEVERDDLPGGHREYRVKTTIRNLATGNIVGQGLGSCSTMESKYRWRNQARKCPSCGKEAIIKGREEYGGGWVCLKKKDGCGANFVDNDPAIINQVVGKVENPDIADVYNTVLKIAKKRSYVDATITATAASDIFTQDAEDFLPETKPAEAAESSDLFDKKPSQGAKPSPAKPRASQPSGPINFQAFIAILNDHVPSRDRPSWMQKAQGGKDQALLGKLAAEIKAAYPQGANTRKTAESMRIEAAEIINTRAPEEDRPGLMGMLEGLADADLEAALVELKNGYGA